MPSAIGAYASLVLVFADAVRQATQTQRKSLEDRVLPLTRDLAEPGITKAREVQLLIRIFGQMHSIMGDTWELDLETRRWIEGLLR